MKTQETIGLNLAATLLVGLITSLFILLAGGSAEPASVATAANYRTTLIFAPIALAGLAAFFQYRFVMKPWHKALGELVGKALNLHESPAAAEVATAQPAAPVVKADQLNLLRQSIETASVQ